MKRYPRLQTTTRHVSNRLFKMLYDAGYSYLPVMYHASNDKGKHHYFVYWHEGIIRKNGLQPSFPMGHLVDMLPAGVVSIDVTHNNDCNAMAEVVMTLISNGVELNLEKR